jgi:hypothetical protein
VIRPIMIVLATVIGAVMVGTVMTPAVILC